MVQINLYDATSIQYLSFPDTPDGQYARDFLVPLMTQNPSYYIQNINTNLMILKVDDVVLPICINHKEYNNSYVCSPYTHYISYAKQELSFLDSKFLRKSLSLLLSGLSPVFKLSRINKTIHVNNWFVSTNLYPNLTSEQLQAVREFLQTRYPKHAILFRSLNQTHHEDLYKAFIQQNFKLVGSRQVYILDLIKRPIKAKSRWLLKRDYKLLKQHQYEIVEADQLSKKDIPRILELYNELYLGKYSKYNPQYTEAFIELALEKKLLHINAIKKNGRIDAVLGYFCRNGVMTTPLFGYDLSIPIETGLYRLLSVRLYHLVLENGHSLNESSGAAQFKRNRGAVGEIEYTAVYDAHLPMYRRWIWSTLQSIINRVGIPIMRKYKL